MSGDEASVSVQGCLYVSGAYCIPGTGSLEVVSLASDQQTSSTHTGGKRMLLVGGSFKARFKVQAPAQQPTGGGPVPDPLNEYSGQGIFLSANIQVRAS